MLETVSCYMLKIISCVAISAIYKITVASSIMAITYGFSLFLQKYLQKTCKRKQIDSHTCLLIRNIAFYAVMILGTLAALQNLDVKIEAFVTALGVTGIALSFGMKDIVSNIVAGILIMIYKQIKINDYVKIKDWEGRVIDINIRYTTLQTDDMKIFVPNAVLYANTVAIVEDKEVR